MLTVTLQIKRHFLDGYPSQIGFRTPGGARKGFAHRKARTC